MCEHYVARGLCSDFPDWSIAAVGSESLVKIGYDYGRSVTGEELTVDLDLYEDEEHNQTTPDLQEEATVAVSAEVCEFFAQIVQNFYYDTFMCALDIG